MPESGLATRAYLRDDFLRAAASGCLAAGFHPITKAIAPGLVWEDLGAVLRLAMANDEELETRWKWIRFEVTADGIQLP